MQLCRWKPFMVSHHPLKFGHHRHCGSGDIMVLVCHVTLQDRVTEGSYDFISWKCIFLIILLRFHDHRPCWKKLTYIQSHDLDKITSPALVWLFSFQSTTLDVPACQIYRSQVLRTWKYCYINSWMNTLGKAILRDFQNQEYWFLFPKSQTLMTKKKNKGNCKALILKQIKK